MSYIPIPDLCTQGWEKHTLVSNHSHEIQKKPLIKLCFEQEPKNYGEEIITTEFEMLICDNTAKISEITTVSLKKRVNFRKETFNLSTKKDFSITFTNECSIELTQYASSEKIVISIGESIIKVDGVNKISYSHPCWGTLCTNLQLFKIGAFFNH